jgi:hypothetical protein
MAFYRVFLAQHLLKGGQEKDGINGILWCFLSGKAEAVSADHQDTVLGKA